MAEVSPITVLLADDNPRVLDLIRQVLGDEFHILGAAVNGEELISEAHRLLPDVVVADISMPRLNGIEAVKKLQTNPAVVFLTSHIDRALVEEAFLAGGMGYVLKQRACEDLPAAIYAALRNEAYVSAPLK